MSAPANDKWLQCYFEQTGKHADPNHPPLSDCPDQSCGQCAVRACPRSDVLHFECNDGCPSCWMEEELQKKKKQSTESAK